MKIWLALGAALLGGAIPTTVFDDTVPYPEGYRRWTHVSSAMQGNPSGGIHNIYANALALEGYRTGRFADGAIIVGDLLELRPSGIMTTAGNRIRVAVMHRDSSRYAATGGWGYEQFRADSRTESMLDGRGPAPCFACHSSRAQTGFVFSSFRE